MANLQLDLEVLYLKYLFPRRTILTLPAMRLLLQEALLLLLLLFESFNDVEEHLLFLKYC